MQRNQQVGLNGLGCTQACREASAPGELYMNDAWSNVVDKVKSTVTSAGGDVASSIANQAITPVQDACKQGATMAIKEYAIPITLGIAATATGLIVLGFFAGKHFRTKA